MTATSLCNAVKLCPGSTWEALYSILGFCGGTRTKENQLVSLHFIENSVVVLFVVKIT